MADRVIHLKRLSSMATGQLNYVDHNKAVIFTNEVVNYYRKTTTPKRESNLNQIVYDKATGNIIVSTTQSTQNFFTIFWAVNIRGSISKFTPSFAVVVERIERNDYQMVYETCGIRTEKTIGSNVIIELPEPDNSADIYTYHISLRNTCEGICYYDSRLEQSASMMLISLSK